MSLDQPSSTDLPEIQAEKKSSDEYEPLPDLALMPPPPPPPDFVERKKGPPLAKPAKPPTAVKTVPSQVPAHPTLQQKKTTPSPAPNKSPNKTAPPPVPAKSALQEKKTVPSSQPPLQPKNVSSLPPATPKTPSTPVSAPKPSTPAAPLTRSQVKPPKSEGQKSLVKTALIVRPPKDTKTLADPWAKNYDTLLPLPPSSEVFTKRAKVTVPSEPLISK
ncbi:hypothetical protein Y032_0395g642 [Ancylostoma ceylanicum]|nr:hypothetical protein Y032_0395g642 [Ancylostoma ceylanicum]